MTNEPCQVDVLAVGAHPDDVELGIGGLMHKYARRGFRTGLLDLTQGEMSSRGAVEDRRLEAQQGAEILNAVARMNARLPDGHVANVPEQRLEVIRYIRMFRPRVLLATMEGDRHPDHHAAYQLVRDAAYFSGLVKINTGQAPYRPPVIFYFHPYTEMERPSLIVDISEDYEAKLAAIAAHATQFYNPAYGGPETHISSRTFWEGITTRAKYWGMRIQKTYGEALYSEDLIGVDLPPGLE